MNFKRLLLDCCFSNNLFFFLHCLLNKLITLVFTNIEYYNCVTTSTVNFMNQIYLQKLFPKERNVLQSSHVVLYLICKLYTASIEFNRQRKVFTAFFL